MKPSTIFAAPLLGLLMLTACKVTEPQPEPEPEVASEDPLSQAAYELCVEACTPEGFEKGLRCTARCPSAPTESQADD